MDSITGRQRHRAKHSPGSLVDHVCAEHPVKRRGSHSQYHRLLDQSGRALLSLSGAGPRRT
jgi:hypothetical protein